MFLEPRRSRADPSSIHGHVLPKEEQHARFRAADFCIPINTIMDCVITETSDEDEFELPDLDLDALMEDL